MDSRGGTITWYLAVDDTKFNAQLAKASAEAKIAGKEIDDSLSGGSSNASTALRKLGDENNNTTATVRNLRKESTGLAGDTNNLKSSLESITGSNGNVATSFSNIAVRSSGLRASLNDTSSGVKTLQSSLGGTALKGFSRDMNDAGNSTSSLQRPLKDTNLSLRDFYSSLGRSASQFRSFSIATRGFQLTSIILTATLAGGAVIQLASAVASLASVLFAAPAAVASFASVLGTLKIATNGITDAFKAYTKQTSGVSSSQKQDASLVKQLNNLTQDYSDTVNELAKERLAELNAVIQKGVVAWEDISKAASDYLDISKSLVDLSQDVTNAQNVLNDSIALYGASSQQAISATRDLYAAQAKVAQANADLDTQYNSIRDSVKDLSTNVNSLAKADRNQLSASLLNLKALKQDKQARGESTDEISNMIDVLGQLINIKDTDLTINPDFTAAQNALDGIKSQFPEIAVAAATSASDTEVSLTKSLRNISQQIADVQQQRADLQNQLSSGGALDPFKDLSKNAKAFVLTLVDLKGAYKDLSDTVQDNFFAGLDVAIRNVATTSLPILRQGLGAIATAMNGVILEAASLVQQPFFTTALASSLNNTAGAVNILRGGVQPLLKAFTDLVNIGNPYVTLLAQATVNQLNLLAAFTGSEKGQKEINNAIQSGIKALKEIAGLVVSVGRLLTDLFVASDKSGFSFVKTLTEIVNKIDDWINTADGQAKLAALFEAANTVSLALAQTLGGFLDTVLGIVKAYNDMDGPFKDIITNTIVWSTILSPIITYLSSIIASLGLLGGVAREGFQAAQVAISGAQKAIVGYQLAQEGLSATEIASSDLAVGRWGKLGAAISGAKDAIVNVTSSIASSAVNIAKSGTVAAAGWVDGAAKSSLAWLKQLGIIIAQGAITATRMVIQAGISAGAWIAGAVATTAAWVIANAAILGIFGLIAAAVVGAVVFITSNWDGIVSFFQDVFKGIQTAVESVVDWVSKNWPLLLALLTGPVGLAVLFITQNFDTIQKVFANAVVFIEQAWGNIVGFFASVGQGIANIFTNIINGAVNGFNNLLNFIRGIPGAILNGLGNLGSLLVNAGVNLVQGLVNGISNAKDAVINKIKEIASGALDTIKKFFGIHSPSRVMAQVGAFVMEGFGNGIESMGDQAVSAAQNAADGVLNAFNGLQTSADALQTDFGVNGTLSTSSLQTTQLAPSSLDASSDTNLSSNQKDDRTINITLNMEGIMSSSPQDERAIAQRMLERINEGLRAKGAQQIGVTQ